MSHALERLLWIALLLVVAVGSVLDVMEVDAAQYASMSRELLASDNWLLLYHRGADYLDKPPLLFWLSALSFKLFGVANWSYKLPSMLAALLAVYATYRFTLLHQAAHVARTAALLFGFSISFLLMTNDVRTDTLLTAAVITAIWLGAAWMEQRRWWQLLGCAVAIAAGMLAKGPMGLVAPALALGGHLLLKRRWDVLRDPRLLLLPVLVALLLLPMCIGLHEQHGMHGLRFFFWEQSFGRITGENRWKDDSSIFYFSHELPWLVLPWTLFVLLGVFQGLRDLVLRRPRAEWASLSGALLVFVGLSLSQFKLPHYLYVVLPLFAVLGAQAWHAPQGPGLKRVQLGLVLLLLLLALPITLWSFPEGGVVFAALAIATLIIVLLSLWRRGVEATALPASCAALVVLGVVLNGHFYPALLRYQANAQAGRWAAAQGLDRTQFFGLQQSGTALDFYSGHAVHWLSNAEEAARVIAPGVVIYTDPLHEQELVAAGLVARERFTLPNYPVQMLGVEMLDPRVRPTVLEQRVLLRF